MKRWPLAVLSVIMIICLGLPAAASPIPGPGTQAQDDDKLPIYPRDEWQVYVSPYIWIPGINASVSALRGSTNTNIAWWDVASRLFSNAIGVMGRAEAWKGRWGLYFDGFYSYIGLTGSVVGATQNQTLGPVNFNLSKEVNLGDQTIRLNIPGQASGFISVTPSADARYISRMVSLDMGGRFLVGAWPMEAGQQFPVLSLEVLGGLRFNSFNQFLRINYSKLVIGGATVDFRKLSLSAQRQVIQNGSYTLDATLQVFEPYIGPRIYIWLGPKFLLSFKGTVGGFGVVAYNDLTCDLEALLGYRVNKNIYAYGGYRARGTWLSVGRDEDKIKIAGWLNGPVLGFSYKF
jgi:hypothetical protein